VQVLLGEIPSMQTPAAKNAVTTEAQKIEVCSSFNDQESTHSKRFSMAHF